MSKSRCRTPESRPAFALKKETRVYHAPPIILPGGKPFPMDPNTSLWALFTSSFLAATLLPGGSEIVLYAVLEQHPAMKWSALGVATLGNTLGGLTSYGIGRLIPQTRPLRGLALLRRYGSPALLLSWVPIVGDPLCVAAGWLRMNAAAATLFIACGKFARYLAIAAIVT
jgi:membrane protein YqaA with SNARE-associated domain